MHAYIHTNIHTHKGRTFWGVSVSVELQAFVFGSFAVATGALTHSMHILTPRKALPGARNKTSTVGGIPLTRTEMRQRFCCCAWIHSDPGDKSCGKSATVGPATLGFDFSSSAGSFSARCASLASGSGDGIRTTCERLHIRMSFRGVILCASRS
jgi:hypothetical protein